MKNLSTDFYSYCHNAIQTINPQFINYTMPNSTGSIFNNGQQTNPEISQLTETEENVQTLEAQLQTAKDEQGIIGKAWNGIKNIFGAKSSSKSAEDAIKKYQNGQISYEEAQNTINKFSQKQKSAADVFSNVATGLATAGIIAATGIATGGLSLAVIGAGALAGGAVKAGLKTIDRATNNIKGDALNAKQIVKDGLSGAVDGAVTTATCGVGKTVQVLGSSAKEAAKIGLTQGIKAGAISGGVTGAANYTLDAAFEDDVKFTLSGLIGATAQNAAAGAVVGGAAGRITNVKAYNKFENMFNNIKPVTGDVIEIGTGNVLEIGTVQTTGQLSG